MNAQNVQQITVSPEHVAKLRDWLANRGGIAVWSHKDLGSPSLGSQRFTPATHEDGSPATSPHWSCGNSGPDFVVTDAAAVIVETEREVSRVKIRRGPPYLGCVHRADRARLDKTLANAGNGAFWRPDYSRVAYGSAWFDAVIYVPATQVPLSSFVS